MAGEQPVFLNLSPEESLANVHERLKQIPEHRVVLIVPQQTQLRSLISWRLLRGYARDLNKEILVISADRQIRSVAKEAQFRVAESLAVPPSSKGRGSNSSRGSTGASRGASNRGVKGLSRFRQSESVQQNSTSSRRPTSGPDQRKMPSPLWQPQSEEPETNELHISNVGEDDELENTDWSASPSFDSGQYDAANRYERPIDFRIASNSPLRPVELTPEPEEEEQDPIPYGYEESQRILQAARQQDKGEDSSEDDTSVLPGPDRMVAPNDRLLSPANEEQTAQENIPQPPGRSSPLSSSLPPSARALEDPFDAVDDFQPSPLSEQRGAAPVFPFDDGEDVADISQYPTRDIPVHGEIEDMGDIDMEELPPLVDDLSPSSNWEEPELEQEAEPERQEEEMYDLPPAYHTPRRSSQLSPAARETAAGTFSTTNPEEKKAIEDQTTRVIPPALSLPDAVARQSASRVASGEPAAGLPPIVSPGPTRQRAPRPVNLPAARTPARPNTANRRFPAPATTKGARSAPRSRKAPTVTRRKQGGRLGPVLVAIAVLLIAGLILFVFPASDVTVTLAAKSYSWPVTVAASTSQNAAQHTVPLYKVPFTASVRQSGKASGTNTSVGTANATGVVQFTNNGSQQVLIPSGTVVSTANNVPFVTTAELLVPAGDTIPVPVQAQARGSSGNVATNTITVIPASSLSQIEQVKENQGVTVKLSVTNPDATTGGGASTATTVTSADVSKLQSSASTQLYRDLQAWLTQKQAQGNVLAKPVPESQLASYEKVTATPAAGQIAASGTFSETVKLSLPVQFVHSRDLQAQAVTQYHQLSSTKTLPKGATRPPKGYEPVVGQQVQLKPESCTSASKSGAANTSTLCFTATAPVALPITTQQVQNLVNGRQVKVVRAQLANSQTGIAGIKAARVIVYPGFWPWMPFWTQRISVHFIASTSASSR